MELNPPPFHIELFDYRWRNWLNFVYEKLRGPLWEDLLAPLAEGKGGGGTFGVPAGPSNINGGPYQAYDFLPKDLLQAAFHVPHTIKPGSKMYFHVHWCTDSTDTGTTTWKIHHQIAKGHSQEAFPTASVITLPSQAATGTAWTTVITECTDAQAIDAPEPDSLILCGVELDADTITTGKIFGLYMDIHYQIDRFGTPGKAPDFYER